MALFVYIPFYFVSYGYHILVKYFSVSECHYWENVCYHETSRVTKEVTIIKSNQLFQMASNSLDVYHEMFWNVIEL